MAYDYELHLIHKDPNGNEKFNRVLTGPHGALFSGLTGKLGAMLEELSPSLVNPNTTRVRLTLQDSVQLQLNGTGTAASYNYELYIHHKDNNGSTKSMFMFAGPHGAVLLPATTSFNVKLDHVQPSPSDPDCVRLSFTLTE